MLLQNGIFGTTAALGAGPDDVLIGIFDLAGLAVQAVWRVKLQTPRPTRFFLQFIHLIELDKIYKLMYVLFLSLFGGGCSEDF